MADRAVNLETVIGMVNTYFRNVLNLNPDLLIDGIVSLPTVDAVPVRHGRWKMVEGELSFWDMCSVCGRKILHRTPYYDFCPYCGAKMDGKDGGNG